jgi:hypothetical protein
VSAGALPAVSLRCARESQSAPQGRVERDAHSIPPTTSYVNWPGVLRFLGRGLGIAGCIIRHPAERKGQCGAFSIAHRATLAPHRLPRH